MTGSESSAPPRRARSWWGWGWDDAQLGEAECIALGGQLPGTLARPLPLPDVASLHVPAPAVAVRRSLNHLVTADPEQRAAHTMGKAYRDVMRALRGRSGRVPDLVAHPETDQDIADLLEWAGEAGAAVVPYGGGSSVTGGVEYRGDAHAAVVSLDLTRMNRVLEIDKESLAARIQAGTLGPALEAQLRPHELTLRHFPQSFEFSTLGGWLATRAGGHYATLRTHIDDFTESLRAITPIGASESWRLPASGAGPSPDRLILGSEGTLGIITEAWMRLQEKPVFKSAASVTFTSFTDALRGLRSIAQSDLHPANCRLLDPGEAALAGASHDGSAVLILGFESAHAPVDHRLGQAIELARSHHGHAEDPATEPGTPADAAVDAWRTAFLRMPYLRDALARMGAIVETFETAVTWDRLPQLIDAVRTEVGNAAHLATGHPATINCRITHVYPDGAAPYFTVLAAGRPGSEVAIWDELKTVANEVLHRHKATITHHHSIGRDHRPAYDRQRPDVFAAALRAAKDTLDPNGILNPGLLIN